MQMELLLWELDGHMDEKQKEAVQDRLIDLQLAYKNSTGSFYSDFGKWYQRGESSGVFTVKRKTM